MPGILDMMGYIQDQGEQGRKRGLAQLLGSAYNAPKDQQQAILSRVAAQGEPGMAYDAQKHFEDMDDTARTKLGQYAMAFDALPDEQKAAAYPQLAAQAQQLGIPAPPQWNPAFAPNITKLAQTLGSAANGGVPSGFREFDMTARAAGLTPGTKEYQQAANIALGREGRASSAGFGFEMIEGADGRKRMGRKNPRTGAFEVYNEQTGAFDPLGGPAQGAASQGMGLPQGYAPAPEITMQTLPGVDVPPGDEVAMLAAAQNEGQAYVPQANGGALPMRQGSAAASGALGVSRRPEDEAAAVEAAKQGVQTSYLPTQERIKADAAVQQARGVKAVDNQAEVNAQNITRTRDADQALSLLDEAERLIPKSTGSTAGHLFDEASATFGKSTEGARAIAALQAIAGQLTSRMPRMQGPQSDKDVQLYKQMAGDLANPSLPRETRMAALRTIRALNRKYASSQPAQDKPAASGWSIQAVP